MEEGDIEDPDLRAEVGETLQMVFSYGIRNSFGMAFDPFSGDLWAGFRVNTMFRAQSASPYTVTTGEDTNGDGVGDMLTPKYLNPGNMLLLSDGQPTTGFW